MIAPLNDNSLESVRAGSAAAVISCGPTPVVGGAFAQFRSLYSLHNSRRHRPWWWVPVLWIDPVRAFGGGFLLKFALGLDSVDWSQTEVPAYCVLLGLLSVAIWCQTYTRRDENVMLAPIGFVIGLIAALTTW